MNISNLKILMTLLLSLFMAPVFAYVECGPLAIKSYYVGDKGWLWVLWENGGAANIHISNPDYKSTLAVVMLAESTNRKVTVRYDNGISCTASPAAILGMWLSKSLG